MKRALVVCLGVAALVVADRPAFSAKHSADQRSCVNVYKSAEKLAKTAHLRQAKALMITCARPACAANLRRVCALRAVQLEEDIPTIVAVAAGGSDAGAGVSVTMDGELLMSHVDGTAVSVDPGPHEFVFKKDETVLVSEKLVIVQGQRNRRIVMAANGAAPERAEGKDPFEAPALPALSPQEQAPAVAASSSAALDAAIAAVDEPSAPVAKKKSVVPWLIGGVGLAGIGAYGVLSYWARKDNALLDQCAPACAQASVDHVKLRYLQADIALAGGAAALLVSTTWLLFRSGGSKGKEVAIRPPIDLHITSRGAVAAVSGSF
jgi:hypothetical protein